MDMLEIQLIQQTKASSSLRWFLEERQQKIRGFKWAKEFSRSKDPVLVVLCD
eukprot:m.250599 g.250599  ORF g.250599 m.250599 type:complete len:52 (+) comp40321_c3_seq67:1338-1493(+)